MQKFIIEKDYFNRQTLPQDLIYQCNKVLRFTTNSRFIVCVDKANYIVQITNINDKDLSYNVIEKIDLDTEIDQLITIIQGYPKGDKFEEIIKHGTELGATEFIPCIMKRTQFKIDEKRQNSKIERFKKIAKEASEQSMRNIVPAISPFIKLMQIDFSLYDYVFVCYEEQSKSGNHQGLKEKIKSLNKGSKIAFLIGPEGGIDQEEIEYLKKLSNIYFISLGKRILRTETASFYVLSILSYERELS